MWFCKWRVVALVLCSLYVDRVVHVVHVVEWRVVVVVLCTLHVECCGILSPVRRALGFPDAHNQKFTSARVVGKVRQGLKSRGYSRRREGGGRGERRREGVRGSGEEGGGSYW